MEPADLRYICDDGVARSAEDMTREQLIRSLIETTRLLFESQELHAHTLRMWLETAVEIRRRRRSILS
jgi:hypothetical protein